MKPVEKELEENHTPTPIGIQHIIFVVQYVEILSLRNYEVKEMTRS